MEVVPLGIGRSAGGNIYSRKGPGVTVLLGLDLTELPNKALHPSAARAQAETSMQ
jgi:hypothetical protein